MKRFITAAFIASLFSVAATGAGVAQLQEGGYTVLRVAPSATDPRIASGEPPHIVAYNPGARPGNILLFLTGTGGAPHLGWFLREALDRGYRVVALSYVDTPAVAQVCHGFTLHDDRNCAEEFRERRIYGDGSAPIQDAPQDAIVNRFTKLLQYLAASDPRASWNEYLLNDAPVWTRVAVAGQSQGGGMAEFIAQRQAIARVVIFSGGWDISGPGKIASWYYGKSETPAERWFGTYNVAEPMAPIIQQSYEALGIPKTQTFALNKPVQPGGIAHGDGISNQAYRDVWDTMLGSGSP